MTSLKSWRKSTGSARSGLAWPSKSIICRWACQSYMDYIRRLFFPHLVLKQHGIYFLKTWSARLSAISYLLDVGNDNRIRQQMLKHVNQKAVNVTQWLLLRVNGPWCVEPAYGCTPPPSFRAQSSQGRTWPWTCKFRRWECRSTFRRPLPLADSTHGRPPGTWWTSAWIRCDFRWEC